MDKIEEMLGYKPDRETRVALLKASKEQNKPIAQIISEGLTVPFMPELLVMDDDDTFYSMKHGKRISLEEYKKTHPMGEWAKLVVIR